MDLDTPLLKRECKKHGVEMTVIEDKTGIMGDDVYRIRFRKGIYNVCRYVDIEVVLHNIRAIERILLDDVSRLLKDFEKEKNNDRN